MGFNKGDDVHYTLLPDSGTEAAANAEFTTNCGVFGRWFFRVYEVKGSVKINKKMNLLNSQEYI
jgi:hypothetical protein